MTVNTNGSVGKTRRRICAVSFGLIVATWFDLPVALRFEWNALNPIFFAGSILVSVPLLGMTLHWNKSNPWIVSNVMLMLSSSVLAGFLVLLVVLFSEDVIRGQIDASFKLTDEVFFNEDMYRLYTKNGGATTSWAQVVRKEKYLGLGLKYVDTVYFEDYAPNGHFENVDDRRLLLHVGEYSPTKDAHTVMIAD